MKGVNKRSRIGLFLMSIVLFFSLVCTSLPVFAAASSEETTMKALQGYVYTAMQNTVYPLENGGSIEGKDLFTGNTTKGFELSENQFINLSSKGKDMVVSDIAKYSNASLTDKNDNGISEATINTWWKELQSKDGVGSRFMGEILKNTKPDFVTANSIYAPFSGVVGTLLGLGAVLIMAFLGLVMVADISYIVLPPIRLFVSDGDGGSSSDGKTSKSKIFSYDAIYAVKVAEEGSGTSGGEKTQALGVYFKRRVVALIILGICMVYLVQGQIYVLVGYILDLVSGFVGF